MMTGTMKHIKYHKNVLNEDGKSFRPIEVSKEIEIKPGYSEDTILVFSKEGHHAYAGHMGDLHIHFVQNKNHKIHWKGNDLILIHKINLTDALLSNQIEVENVDGEKIKVLIDEMITP